MSEEDDLKQRIAEVERERDSLRRMVDTSIQSFDDLHDSMVQARTDYEARIEKLKLALAEARCCGGWLCSRRHHVDCPLMARDRVERAEQWRVRALAAEQRLAEVERERDEAVAYNNDARAYYETEHRHRIEAQKERDTLRSALADATRTVEAMRAEADGLRAAWRRATGDDDPPREARVAHPMADGGSGPTTATQKEHCPLRLAGVPGPRCRPMPCDRGDFSRDGDMRERSDADDPARDAARLLSRCLPYIATATGEWRADGDHEMANAIDKFIADISKFIDEHSKEVEQTAPHGEGM